MNALSVKKPPLSMPINHAGFLKLVSVPVTSPAINSNMGHTTGQAVKPAKPANIAAAAVSAAILLTAPLYSEVVVSVFIVVCCCKIIAVSKAKQFNTGKVWPFCRRKL